MKDLNYYLNLPYKIELKKIPQNEGGGWGAFMPELNKVAFFYGDGESKEQALAELETAFKVTIEALLNEGIVIPEPIENDAIKRINITMPQSLVNAIDKVTTNRSAWLSELARRELAL